MLFIFTLRLFSQLGFGRQRCEEDLCHFGCLTRSLLISRKKMASSSFYFTYFILSTRILDGQIFAIGWGPVQDFSDWKLPTVSFSGPREHKMLSFNGKVISNSDDLSRQNGCVV